jgi:hypothetical protein
MLGLVAGCHNGGHAQNSTEMRALHAVIDAEALDVLVTDDAKFSAIPLTTTTAFTNFDSGSLDVKIRSSTNQAILAERTLSLNSGAVNTLALYGKRGNMGLLLLPEGVSSPSSGKFRVRAVGFSLDSGPVDLYLTTGSVNDTTPAISGVTLGTATAYSEFTPGSFNFYITTSGTKELLFSSTAQNLTAGQSITFGVFPSAGGKLVNGVMLVEGDGGAGTYLANPSSRMKVMNAIADSTPLNFKVDGTTLLASVPFGGSSSYVTLAQGNHALQLEASNVPGSIIATKTQAFDAARDYTVMSVDTFAAPRLISFADDNTFPASGYAKVRFINALPSAPGADVLVNFASQASGLTYGSASTTYSQFIAALNYTIQFSTPGGVTVIATLSNVELDAGVVYTAVLTGPASAPQIKLVRDR